MKTRAPRKAAFGASSVGRVWLPVFGILLTQLGAIAVNSATSSGGAWPLGLEQVRRHPFAWSAGLTAVLALLAIMTSRLDADRAERTAKQRTAELLLLQLSEIAREFGSLRRKVDWCHRELKVVLEGSAAPGALEATEIIRHLRNEVDQSRHSLQSPIDGALARVRHSGGRMFIAPPQARDAPGSAVDESIIDLVKASTENYEQSVFAMASWVRLVIEQLRDVDADLQLLKIDLEGARDLFAQLPDVGPQGRDTVAKINDRSSSWREDLDRAAASLAEYVESCTGRTSEQELAADVPSFVRIERPPGRRS